jgi:glutaredoxin
MSLLRRKRPKVRVEIYSKKECHLCDDAKALLHRARKSFPFEMIETDITKDKTLFEEYKEQIPVIFINGRKAFKFKVDEKLFRKRLAKILDP